MAILLQDATLWVLFSFIIFCFMGWKFGKDKIIGALDKKIEEIRKEIETAESLRVEAQELLAQYQRKQRDVAKESEQIIETAKKHAREIQKNAEKALKEQMARREDQLAERIRRMEESAIQEVQAYAAGLAVEATAEIIAKELNKEANEKLISQSVQSVAAQLG
jgi:F-type H+-transporting ATPase subunit b